MRVIEGSKNILLNRKNSSDQICMELKLYCEDKDAFNVWKKSFEWVFNGAIQLENGLISKVR